MALVAEFSGDHPAHLRPDSRIVHDLSLYGHDAADFFATFEDRFGVDMRPLYSQWPTFFPPEVPYGAGFLLVLGIVLLGPLLLFPFGINPVWGWVLAVPGLLIWRFGFNEWPLTPRTYRPITVSDLITAARRRRWDMTSN